MTNQLSDVMNYYLYNFISVYVIFIIAIGVTVFSSKKNSGLKCSIFVNVLSVAALLFNMIFMGVLADNQAPSYEIWSNQNLAFLVILSIAIVIQIFRLLFKRKNK